MRKRGVSLTEAQATPIGRGRSSLFQDIATLCWSQLSSHMVEDSPYDGGEKHPMVGVKKHPMVGMIVSAL